MSLSLDRHAHTVDLVLHEAVDFGSARDIMVVSLLVGLWQIGNALTGQKLPGRAELAFAQPAYMPRFSHFLPDVCFDAPAHKLVFSNDLLLLPLIQADPAAQRLAMEQCQRELEALRADISLCGRVAGLLERGNGFPSLEDVAHTLALSPRTLKRRLKDEATTFSAILDEERKKRACRLLHDHDLSVEDIAERLGYSDAANFSRAFRRLFGMSPRDYRRSHPG
jgi:AraC-like DNA-binding protein